MTPRTIRFIGGTSEALNTPLSDGTVLIEACKPLVVTNVDDYDRLMSSNKYQDITAAVEASAEVPPPAPAPAAAPTVSAPPVQGQAPATSEAAKILEAAEAQ